MTIADAIYMALQHGYYMQAVRRTWWVLENGELTGPYWEMTFVAP